MAGSLLRRRIASYSVFVHRFTALLHASFRPFLAETPLRFATLRRHLPVLGLSPMSCQTCPAHRRAGKHRFPHPRPIPRAAGGAGSRTHNAHYAYGFNRQPRAAARRLRFLYSYVRSFRRLTRKTLTRLFLSSILYRMRKFPTR